MTKQKSVLDELYSDSGAFDKERMVTVLKSILVIQRGEHSVFFKPGLTIKNEDKVLAYALVKKLLHSEGAEESAGVSGKETHLKTGVAQGTVDPAIQKLKKEGFLLGKGSNYEIPNRQVETVLQKLDAYKTKKGA